MQKCILCQLKGNNSQSDLICELCDGIRHSPAARFTEMQAMGDFKNKITAFTLTLKPKYHHVIDTDIYKYYKRIAKETIRQFRTPSFVKFWIEYTDQKVVHAHGYIASRPRPTAMFAARARKLGFCLLKPVTNLCDWETYCSKNMDTTSLPPYSVCS